jgi:hypothetical protein
MTEPAMGDMLPPSGGTTVADVESKSRSEGDRADLTITNLDDVVRARESHGVMRAYFGQYFLAYMGLSCLVTVVLVLTIVRTYSDSGAAGFQFAIEPLRLATGMALFACAAAVILFVLSWFQFLPRQLAMLWPGLVGPLAALTNAYASFIFIDPLAASLQDSAPHLRRLLRSRSPAAWRPPHSSSVYLGASTPGD